MVDNELISSKDPAFCILKKALNPNQFVLKLIPRRALLRIGMLLRDSHVAQQVRTYLLDSETAAVKNQPVSGEVICGVG